MSMSAEAKRALAATISKLRERLTDDLHRATDATYRLGVSPRDARLDERTLDRRTRLTRWIDEQHRAQTHRRGTPARTEDDFQCEAELQAAYTLINRLIVLKLMEAPGPSGRPLRAPALVSGGWQSRAYSVFRQLAPGLTTTDDTEGYAHLLQLTFNDLAHELPGVFGTAGIAELIPVPAAVLRHAIEVLNDDALASCWTDDLTLGWVYQYWNDSAREALDAKLKSGGKLQPHEIASKTQLFTERYMVDWLLQNSLNPMWLSICRKHSWTPEVESDGTLHQLKDRRAEWRSKRERGEVELSALMPLNNERERHWAYYIPQETPEEAVLQAPESVRDLKILDPAVGSGHFLVVALDLLTALYREEARQRGEQGEDRWDDRAIVEHILSYNLHGIDIDPRAIQIAAATLWLKARQIAPNASPERVNLVAPNLRLSSLPDEDPALRELRDGIEREAGIPHRLTDTIVQALRGADHLGSLLKLDTAVEAALDQLEWTDSHGTTAQGEMFSSIRPPHPRQLSERAATRKTVLDRIDTFLNQHSHSDDLGLRLRGEQLAAGVRFARLNREGSYDVVVGNPPYQGTGKMADSAYVTSMYHRGRADLFAAFLLRGLELVRRGGVSAMLTMRGWMFLKQFAPLRQYLLATHGFVTLGDLDWGAFSEMKDVKVAMSVFRRDIRHVKTPAIAPTGTTPSGRTTNDFLRKNAGLLLGTEKFAFDPSALKIVPDWPLVYWWNSELLQPYRGLPLLGAVAPARATQGVYDNTRFTRLPHELAIHHSPGRAPPRRSWQPFINGAAGRDWVEPCRQLVRWDTFGLEPKLLMERRTSGHVYRYANEHFFFATGVAFSMVGNRFSGRKHRYPSVFGDKGRSVFHKSPADIVCLMNTSRARKILSSLNPGINFQAGDVNRLPMILVDGATTILNRVEAAFGVHEARREPSIEFCSPGPSPWRYAQAWAQAAVDRPEGTPLPDYAEERDSERPTDHVSFALGVALGRFGNVGSNTEGVLDPNSADHVENIERALPHGILFLDTTLGDADDRDSLGHLAAKQLRDAWTEYGPAISGRRSVREWLALDCFKDVHRAMYENRPIYLPLSSSGRTFVAWVNIHRMNEQTLRVLLADHLLPAVARLEGQIDDLHIIREGGDRAVVRAAEKQFDTLTSARTELLTFIADVEQCAERGAPPTDPMCSAREQDVRYAPDLDDGVMINAAALWPLLDPQWRDPKQWWKELSTVKGRKDYDWSHLAMRYWPKRVDAKCREDPSLAVAHGCFWRYHPERAWPWELRLQHEIGAGFRIEERHYAPGGQNVSDAGDAPHRDNYIAEQSSEALEYVEKEAIRRMGRGAKRQVVNEMHLLESGLWSNEPELVWELELRLSERQGVEFRLRSPDERTARAAYESENPDRARGRAARIAKLEPPSTLFEESDEEDEDESVEPLNDDSDAEDTDDS